MTDEPAMLNVLSKDFILSRTQNAGSTRDVYIPEWNGYVRLRAMTLGERNRLLDKAEGAQKKGVGAQADLMALAAFRCIVNEAGSPMFTDDELNELMKHEARVMQRIIDEALKLNGLSGESVATAEKN